MSKSDPQGERLLRSRAYIDGDWVGDPVTPVVDKATGETIARVPDMGAEHARIAVAARAGQAAGGGEG